MAASQVEATSATLGEAAAVLAKAEQGAAVATETAAKHEAILQAATARLQRARSQLAKWAAASDLEKAFEILDSSRESLAQRESEYEDSQAAVIALFEELRGMARSSVQSLEEARTSIAGSVKEAESGAQSASEAARGSTDQLKKLGQAEHMDDEAVSRTIASIQEAGEKARDFAKSLDEGQKALAAAREKAELAVQGSARALELLAKQKTAFEAARTLALKHRSLLDEARKAVDAASEAVEAAVQVLEGARMAAK